jgi:hypothetical protein
LEEAVAVGEFGEDILEVEVDSIEGLEVELELTQFGYCQRQGYGYGFVALLFVGTEFFVEDD